MRKKQIFFYLIITLIFFGILYKLEYATDTYAVFNFNKDEIFNQFASSGRFVTAIVGKIIKILKVPNYAIYSGSYILAIVCCIISQYKIFRIVEKEVKSKILQILIPTLIIINPFSIELFLFIEKGIMLLAVLMCIKAVENLIKYFESQKKAYILKAIIFMFIANFSYQGVVGIFVAISLVYILKYSKIIKEFIRNNLITAIIYGVPALLDYILVKFMYKAGRVNGEILLVESLKKIVEQTQEMIQTTYGILPKNVYLVAVIMVVLLSLGNIKNLFRNLYIISGIILVSVFPQIMQPTLNIWFVARSTYPFASMLGVLTLVIGIWQGSDWKNTCLVFIGISVLLLQLKSFIRIEQDRYLLNKEDEEISLQIIEKIQEYEKQAGKKIEKISIYGDENLNWKYDDIFTFGDTNIKAYYADWSVKEIVEYYLGRKLERIENEENLKKEFLEKDWNQFSCEQIKIKDNILNLCRW